jgi:hypothetical protein
MSVSAKDKYVLFIKTEEQQDRAHFQRQYLSSAHEYLGSAPVAARLIVNLVNDPPPNRPYRPPNDLTIAPDAMYDVIVEFSPSDSCANIDHHLQLISSLVVPVRACHVYRVEEVIEKGGPCVAAGTPSPGMKYFGQLVFHPDLPDSAARRSWTIHAALAKTVHVGATKYVRNWVVEQIGDSAPRTQGIVELHFPTLDDLLHRFFDSERGKMQILHDTSHFIAQGARYYTTEYVLASDGGLADADRS